LELSLPAKNNHFSGWLSQAKMLMLIFSWKLRSYPGRKKGTIMSSSTHEITHLLIKWKDGDQEALDELMPLIYDDLHQMARQHMSRQKPGHTLQTTALIHEAFIKIFGQSEKHFQNRSHFFAVAAQAMRHILVNYALSRKADKRGGGNLQVSLDEALIVSDHPVAELVALDDALNELAKIDLRKSKVVEMRYFGGLSVDETAEVLKVSPITVMRDWGLAKAWLHRELSKG